MGGGGGRADGPDGPTRVPPKLPPPNVPPGMKRSDLGNIWGRPPAETLHMMENLNAKVVQDHMNRGFTKDLANQWYRFYTNKAARNPSNEAALARMQFLQKFLGLSK
ncbi:MAG: DUF4951 domain-containing protein [Hyphomicrobium sp.]